MSETFPEFISFTLNISLILIRMSDTTVSIKALYKKIWSYHKIFSLLYKYLAEINRPFFYIRVSYFFWEQNSEINSYVFPCTITRGETKISRFSGFCLHSLKPENT